VSTLRSGDAGRGDWSRLPLAPKPARSPHTLPSMPDYTIKNLMEVDDSAAGRGPGIEARFARKHLDSEHLGVSMFRYGPGYRAPIGHHHREQEEAYVVVGGSGRIKLGDEIIELRRWDVVRVSPTVVRGFEGGPEGMELIAIGSDRPEGGDGEMVQDFWPA
jgi:mannose-6-phosphate isomerase-like protein (cupin superfamily)